MPAVNLRHIEIFHAVMTTGNLTEAARMLHTSQPTVSRELARFEKVLGLQLFERTRGRLQPTVQGLRLFEEVQRSGMAGPYRQRRREPARVPPGRAVDRLSAGVFPVLSAAAVAAVSRSLPGGQPADRPQESPLLEEWLSAQRHDLGLTETLHTPAGTERTPLLTLNEVCVLPAGHPLAAQATLTPPIFRAKTTSACRAPTAIASCSTPCSLSIRLNGGWWSKPTARPRSAPWCAPAPGSRW